MIFGRALGIGRRQGHLGDALGQRRIQPPLGSIAIGLAARPVTGRQPGDLKPRMVFKQLNIALTDHSGRAQNADGIFAFHGHKHSSVQEDGYCPPNSQPRSRGIYWRGTGARLARPA